jgi:N-hydroxyarylamine O-acetyltransferase
LSKDRLAAYLKRLGLAERPAADAAGLGVLQRAHRLAIPFENLDIPLGRGIRIDLDSLVAKLVDDRRGGYCYEQNLLFSSVLESCGFMLTRHLGRVRLGDPVNPRPGTHMVLVVDGCAVDVGFGSATPLAPVPLDGAVTVGAWTWSTDRVTSPEGEDVWAMRCNDVLLYTFSEERRHPVDYVTPNHYSSTHPESVFLRGPTVQRSYEDVQRTLFNGDRIDRFPDGRVETTAIVGDDYASVLRDLGLDLPAEDLQRLQELAGLG